MAIQKIQPSDKLNSGFRSKYNATVDELWVSISDLGGGVIRISKFNGGSVDVHLNTSFYTKEDLRDIVSGVGPATEENAGVIRIATDEEALAGNVSNAAITPATLKSVIDAITFRKVKLTLSADSAINWIDDEAIPGITFAQLIGDDFAWSAYHMVGSKEVSYQPTVAITRNGSGDITTVDITDVNSGYIIIT